MRSLLIVSGALALLAAQGVPAQPSDNAQFLKFPITTAVSSANVPAFAWVVRQGENSALMFAKLPDFKPVKLFAQTDIDGQPISSATISPDGEYIAFQTGTPFGSSGDAFNPAGLIETPKVTLFVIAARAGAKPVKVGVGANPRFTPDGTRLVYRQGRDLMAVELKAPSAKPTILVQGGAGLGPTIWSKDGKSMIFAQDRGGWSFLGRYTLGDDRVDWLVTGADLLSSPKLSPDGKTVAYLRSPGREHTVSYDLTENRPFAVETVDLDSKQVQTLYEAKGQAGSPSSDDVEGHLRWADDRNIVFRSEEDGWARLYAIAREGGAPRALTPTECEVAESELAGPDTLFVVHNCLNIDTRQISRLSVSSGRMTALPSKDVVMGLANAVGDGRYVTFTGSTTDDAPLLRVLDLEAETLALAEKPSDHGYVHRFTTPAPQVVRIKASDGGTVPAQLFLPRTVGPHPALVYVHGGPPRQMFPAFHFGSYYSSDYAVNRQLAELGYVVVSINFRSGTGYGRAFREAPGRAWRGASEYNDVLGAGRWLAQRDDVDRKRIGIWGGSYGGLMTGQALARNSDLFSAGVAVHGVFDWSWPSPTPGHQNPSRLFGVGEADKALAFRSSPLGQIAGWTSPVLLVSGDRDMNVDVLETVDLHQKLRDKGVDVRTVLIPGEAHDMVRHSSRLQFWSEARGFLSEKLGK